MGIPYLLSPHSGQSGTRAEAQKRMLAEAVVKAHTIREVAKWPQNRDEASKGRNQSIRESRAWWVRFRACIKAKGEKALGC